jgi:hypothetical protein
MAVDWIPSLNPTATEYQTTRGFIDALESLEMEQTVGGNLRRQFGNWGNGAIAKPHPEATLPFCSRTFLAIEPFLLHRLMLL